MNFKRLGNVRPKLAHVNSNGLLDLKRGAPERARVCEQTHTHASLVRLIGLPWAGGPLTSIGHGGGHRLPVLEVDAEVTGVVVRNAMA